MLNSTCVIEKDSVACLSWMKGGNMSSFFRLSARDRAFNRCQEHVSKFQGIEEMRRGGRGESLFSFLSSPFSLFPPSYSFAKKHHTQIRNFTTSISFRRSHTVSHGYIYNPDRIQDKLQKSLKEKIVCRIHLFVLCSSFSLPFSLSLYLRTKSA